MQGRLARKSQSTIHIRQDLRNYILVNDFHLLDGLQSLCVLLVDLRILIHGDENHGGGPLGARSGPQSLLRGDVDVGDFIVLTEDRDVGHDINGGDVTSEDAKATEQSQVRLEIYEQEEKKWLKS